MPNTVTQTALIDFNVFKRYKLFYNSTRYLKTKSISQPTCFFQLSDDAHFHLPVHGIKEQTLIEGHYLYLHIIDQVGSVFIVVDSNIYSKANMIIQAILMSYPILVIIIVLVMLAGIVIWFVVCF